jgi:ABC-2 type transport system ATP-binding protein
VNAIRTERLTKYYGAVVGLEALTLDVPAGEIFGFLGPNGAGKTTTIRLLLDLVRATHGDAWVAGFHCRREGLSARGHIGFLPGELPIYPELSGTKFLKHLQAVGQRPVDDAKLTRLLKRFDVSDVDLNRPMREYSHGMKRKLGIIQALAPDPAVLILDEPTNGLDPLMIEAFAETLNDLKQSRKTTVFLSSHVLSEVERTCDRVGLIRRGALVALASISELRATLPRQVSVTFGAAVVPRPLMLDRVTVLSQTERKWVVTIQGALGTFVAAIADLPIEDISVEPFTLEDYVLRFYSGSRQ